MAQVPLTYRYRLQPTPEQESALDRFAGARRFVWNWALSRRQTQFRATKRGLSAMTLSDELTRLKLQPDTAWLREIDSQLLQQALHDLQRAFSAFFDGRARYPRFKSRKRDEPRFRIPQRVTISAAGVLIPKLGLVPVVYHREVSGKVKGATFKRDALGHWYVTLVVEQAVEEGPVALPPDDRVVGVDLGLKDFAVLSDGTRVSAPRLFRQGQRKLARAQRRLSRAKPGGKNREKRKREVAREHARIRQQRTDFLHKLSHTLLRDYDAVCLEDLNVKGLARTKLAKSVYDAAWGEFRRMLTYKAARRCKLILMVDRFFPSSKQCGTCGMQASLSLSDRTWICAACGTAHDRDLNAAINIKREALAVATGYGETQNAGGAHVRPSMTAMCDEPGNEAHPL